MKSSFVPLWGTPMSFSQSTHCSLDQVDTGPSGTFDLEDSSTHAGEFFGSTLSLSDIKTECLRCHRLIQKTNCQYRTSKDKTCRMI